MQAHVDPEGAISQNLNQVALGIQAAAPASAGNTATQSGQSSPSAGATPVHLTAFLNPEALRSGQSVPRGQLSEVSANQKDGSGLGSVTRAVIRESRDGRDIGSLRLAMRCRRAMHRLRKASPLTSGDRGVSRLPHAAGLIAEVIPFDRATLGACGRPVLRPVGRSGCRATGGTGVASSTSSHVDRHRSRCRCGDRPTAVTGPGQRRPRPAAAGSHRE